ncbi:hypothetical protein ZWY2020_001553 [Hordeum vulgare]|nr:hypothetical protein ZWY2020_001553 [Hordeum vulgare]
MIPTPVIESEVRRCMIGSSKRDGSKPIFHELKTEPKKNKPRCKPFPESSTFQQETGDSYIVAPPTLIREIQRMGEDLRIDAETLMVERLMTEPTKEHPVASDD